MDPLPPPNAAARPDAEDEDSIVHALLSLDGGCGVTLWSDPGVTSAGETLADAALQLRPERPVVVGRQQGGRIEYLDPRYTSTQMVPDTSRSVLTRAGDGKDTYVSRGHFLLRAAAGGIVLVNGVPRRGGGIRPPVNGTWLLEPEYRCMREGEEYLIAHGSSAKIHLPNGTRILINAGEG
jgi:hypothetical protein